MIPRELLGSLLGPVTSIDRVKKELKDGKDRREREMKPRRQPGSQKTPSGMASHYWTSQGLAKLGLQLMQPADKEKIKVPER